MRRALLLLLLGAMMLAMPAHAADPRQQLFVELVVNGRSTGDVVELALAGEAMIVPVAALRRNGVPLAPGDEGEIDVARRPDLGARYDAALQQLHLTIAPDRLPVARIAATGAQRMASVADWGAMLNYELYGQTAAGRSSAALWTEQRLFGPAGTLSNTGTWRSGAGYLRYDTSIRRIDEDRALGWAAGDLITRALPWTTAIRMGGIQVARDFGVRPDLVTMPLPRFAGQAAVPSAVDLFVDGYRRQSATVEPGRFLLDNIPVVNGAGEATIVTTDAVGRQIATTIPFYVSASLLRPGLSDGGAEIGFVRRGYGLRSFGYGPLVASGTWRRGTTERLTLEAHGEMGGGVALAGIGAVVAPWRIGTLSLSAARSNGAMRYSLGYSYAARGFSIAALHEERDRRFRDLGDFDLRSTLRNRRADRVIASVTLGRHGSLGAAYLDGRALDGARARIASLSYSRPLFGHASLFVSADRDVSTGRTSAQLRLFVPFGRNAANAGISRTGGRNLYQIGYARAMPASGGLGVDANIATDASGTAYGQATATWRARPVTVQAGGAVVGGARSAWGSVSGALVAMDHGVFAANQVSDAFAVVATGTRGVKVAYENQTIGVTDARGYLFVPNIVSWLPSRFSIDPLALSVDHVAPQVETRLAVRRASGAVVRLPVRRSRNVTLKLVDPAGRALAPGGRVTRAGMPDAVTGWDGVVYLEDVGAHIALDVLRRDGIACRANADLPATATAMPDLGVVPCR